MPLHLWVLTTFSVTAANTQRNPVSQPCPNLHRDESQGIFLRSRMSIFHSKAYEYARFQRRSHSLRGAASELRPCAPSCRPCWHTPAAPAALPGRPGTFRAGGTAAPRDAAAQGWAGLLLQRRVPWAGGEGPPPVEETCDLTEIIYGRGKQRNVRVHIHAKRRKQTQTGLVITIT